MMYARTEFIYAVLLVASFLVEGAKATLQVRAGTTIVLASPSVSSTAMLSFHSLPQPTSCASTTFSWSYSGPIDPLLLQITNVGVSQDPPPPTTILSTRILAPSTAAIPIAPKDLTETLVTNYDPALLSYLWNTVNVSQGWYMLLATISTDRFSQMSSPFFVRTGTNTSCLTGIIPATNTPTITPSTSSSRSSNTSLPVSSPASGLSSTSTSKVPTIVGVSVGMAVLVLGSVIVWFILARKRRSRTSEGNYKNNYYRWKGLNDSRGGGGFDANAPNKRYHSSRSHLNSHPASIATSLGLEFDDSIIGAEKGSDEQGVALSTLPVLHHQSSRPRPDQTYSASSSTSNVNDFGGKPSVRYSTQHSIDSSAVYPPSSTFSPRESGQYTVASDMPRSHSLTRTGTQYSLSNNSIDLASPISPISPSSFPLPPSTTSRETNQMHRNSLGKKRKPVPVYDASVEEPISSSTASFTIPALSFSTNTESTFAELSHKSSFGPGGIEGKQLHYLIPDMPLSQTS